MRLFFYSFKTVTQFPRTISAPSSREAKYRSKSLPKRSTAAEAWRMELWGGE